MMHIGHEYTTCYAMEDGNRLKNLEPTEKEKDLGIVISQTTLGVVDDGYFWRFRWVHTKGSTFRSDQSP